MPPFLSVDVFREAIPSSNNKWHDGYAGANEHHGNKCFPSIAWQKPLPILLTFCGIGKKPLHGEGQHRRHGTMVSQDGRNPSASVPFLMWAILASLGRCANLTHQRPGCCEKILDVSVTHIVSPNHHPSVTPGRVRLIGPGIVPGDHLAGKTVPGGTWPTNSETMIQSSPCFFSGLGPRLQLWP